MKKTCLLLSMLVMGILSSIQAQKGPYSPVSLLNVKNMGASVHNHLNPGGLHEVRSDKWNDSIHFFTWKPTLSDWWFHVREIRSRSPYGNVSARIYLDLDTTTQQWINNELDEMEYFGTTSDNQKTSYKTWDPVTASWIQTYYQHYYSPGNLDEYFYKNWNPVTRKFTYGSRYTYQYDLNGNRTEEIDQMLDTATLQWVNYYKESNLFNTTGITEKVTMNWDTATGSWVNIQRMIYNYDANNFLTSTERYSWLSSAWILSGHSLFTNNAAGLPLEQLDEYWNGASWDPSYRISYTYDGAGNMLTKLSTSYNYVIQDWQDQFRITNTYFGNGDLNTTLSEVWNTNAGTWFGFSYRENDTFGNSINSYYISLNMINFHIYSGSKYLGTYDVNGRCLQDLYQKLDTASSTWVDSDKSQYTYEAPDNSYYIEELGTIWDGANWVNSYKNIFFWSYPSGIGNNKFPSRLCYYENPLQPGRPVNCPELDPSKVYQFDIFTMKGESIYNEAITGGASFLINRDLPSGNYILRISEKGRTLFSDKVVAIN